jgi:hypothetical protein
MKNKGPPVVERLFFAWPAASNGGETTKGRPRRQAVRRGDAFLSLSKTCAKLGIAFDYLGARLAVPNHPDVPALPQLIKQRCATI